MLLAVESSCDESALALFDPAHGIRANLVHSQVALHGEYGGVVPDLARREHLKNLPGLLRLLPADFSTETLRAVAVTRGPGLAGCLALGIAFAKALAFVWDKPLIGINHLRGHLFSPFIALHGSEPKNFASAFAGLLPHFGVVVSGGNTLMVSLEAGGQVTVLAQTVDDAAGEAFDKGAKLLGLPYPGGSLIEKLALSGDPTRFDFPRGIAEKADPRLSFSGLKTSLRYRLEKLDDAVLSACLPDICAGYQASIIAQLLSKAQAQLAARPFASIGLSGGVANNQALRTAFAELAHRKRLPLLTAERTHSGDNAAMIAFAAYADAALPSPAQAAWHMGFQPSLRIDQA
ncbi:MAG: tRNA (adenosine(37)-N6)-threonylcarbamoyltransferase complex transferase subunit TsaD [Puniceicoccales bacterium]|jgi:N6-L-threonylcarbamoyladenine synthase|nr:tRNA (adenosine(37)-N6)-threonylcarbamoyltransferase complex transferase subunit TsaD [Puniceicoccales bacterium]